MIDDEKRAAAWAAVEEVRPGMLIGLGTGSTAAFAIARLGEKVRDGLAIRAVCTSLRTEALARQAGIDPIDFADIDSVDLTIDGTDEIDDRFFAIKGAGGAMLREKVVAAASRRMIVIADASKRVAAIGHAPVPVEILPFARAFVSAQIADLGARPVLRLVAGGPYRTDQGNLVIDCHLAGIPDPVALAGQFLTIPGIVGHGLFLDEVDCAYIGNGDRAIRLDRPQAGTLGATTSSRWRSAT
jgi:ribose 5-phosphate isomerase A